MRIEYMHVRYGAVEVKGLRYVSNAFLNIFLRISSFLKLKFLIKCSTTENFEQKCFTINIQQL